MDSATKRLLPLAASIDLNCGRWKVNAIYEGQRIGQDEAGGSRVRVIHEGRNDPLNLRLDLRNHSPTGFNWGYGGSGPAQLALAILADFTGQDDLAQVIYQEFKFAIIARMDAKLNWALSGNQLIEIVADILEHRHPVLPAECQHAGKGEPNGKAT